MASKSTSDRAIFKTGLKILHRSTEGQQIWEKQQGCFIFCLDQGYLKSGNQLKKILRLEIQETRGYVTVMKLEIDVCLKVGPVVYVYVYCKKEFELDMDHET